VETIMNNSEPNDVVRLLTATNPAQAHIVEQALKAQGIQAKVVGDYLDVGLGNVSGVQAEIWVHRDDVARAIAILPLAREWKAE
jgi:hypothetical protein